MNNTLHGIWKLNVGNSLADPGPLVRSETRVYEATGDNGLQLFVKGIDATGAAYSYGATGRIDGKDYPLIGSGTRNGADSTSWTRVDPHTIDSTVKKAGHVVNLTQLTISTDGKILVIRERGTNPTGQATRGVRTYDRQ